MLFGFKMSIVLTLLATAASMYNTKGVLLLLLLLLLLMYKLQPVLQTETPKKSESEEELLSKDEINAPIALGALRDGDQGPSKVTKPVPKRRYLYIQVGDCPRSGTSIYR